MKTEIITSTSISYGELNGIDNELLKNHCLNNSKRMSEDVANTRYEDFNFPMINEFQKVINCITIVYNQTFEKKLELINFWSQIHKPNESTNIHNHLAEFYEKNCPDISGVYYVSIPKNSGRLTLQTYANPAQYHRNTFIPKESIYVLFPSSLDHFVTKNLSDDLRISISFNFKIKNKSRNY